MEGYQLGRDFEALNSRVSNLEARLDSSFPGNLNGYEEEERIDQEIETNDFQEVEIEREGTATKVRAKRFKFRNSNRGIEFKDNPSCAIYEDGVLVFRATIKNNLGSAWSFKGKVILTVVGTNGIIGAYRKGFSLEPNEKEIFRMEVEPPELARDWSLITGLRLRWEGTKIFDPFSFG